MSKRNPPPAEKPAPRQGKAKTPGASGDGTPSPRQPQPPPPNRSYNPQMASRRTGAPLDAATAAAAAAAKKLAEDRNARDARAATRLAKTSTTSGDGSTAPTEGSAPNLSGAPPTDSDSSSGKDTATALSGLAASVPPAASATPSLASLINPTSTTSGKAHHVALPATPAPSSQASKAAPEKHGAGSTSGPNEPTLKYPVPPSLTAAPRGPEPVFLRFDAFKLRPQALAPSLTNTRPPRQQPWPP
ncbi:hypothetical protein K438DRAFT_1782925 [Mycena galopus ATCC 62051]|nr:hypothetical protein K438DRAFT_1782925 [Mycena galopus ATCC 62051]